jgi:hypothetical protein
MLTNLGNEEEEDDKIFPKNSKIIHYQLCAQWNKHVFKL